MHLFCPILSLKVNGSSDEGEKYLAHLKIDQSRDRRTMSLDHQRVNVQAVDSWSCLLARYAEEKGVVLQSTELERLLCDRKTSSPVEHNDNNNTVIIRVAESLLLLLQFLGQFPEKPELVEDLKQLLIAQYWCGYDSRNV